MQIQQSAFLDLEQNQPDPNWCSWFSGFIDGEGCFMLRVTNNHPQLEFRIQLRDDDKDVLIQIQKTLGCGYTEPHRQSNPNWSPAFMFRLSRINHIVNILIPILDKYPLRAKKMNDYKLWREAALVVYNKEHKFGKADRLKELVSLLHIVKEYNGHGV